MTYDLYVRDLSVGCADAALHPGHGSMWELVEDAVALGMAFHSAAPAFPDDPGDEHVGFEGDREVGRTDVGRAYVERKQAALSAHGGDVAGIPAHKLRSNHGWHVTRAECLAALASYDKAATHPASFRDDLIPFLRCAAEHDGFEVR